jgi:hypothetical protein
MPFNLGHDVARLIPALRPIAEAGEEAAHFLRWSPDRTLEQVSDLALQDGVGRQPDRITVALGFEELAERLALGRFLLAYLTSFGELRRYSRHCPAERLARSPDTVKDYGQLARQSHPRLA